MLWVVEKPMGRRHRLQRQGWLPNWHLVRNVWRTSMMFSPGCILESHWEYGWRKIGLVWNASRVMLVAQPNRNSKHSLSKLVFQSSIFRGYILNFRRVPGWNPKNGGLGRWCSFSKQVIFRFHVNFLRWGGGFATCFKTSPLRDFKSWYNSPVLGGHSGSKPW